MAQDMMSLAIINLDITKRIKLYVVIFLIKINLEKIMLNVIKEDL